MPSLHEAYLRHTRHYLDVLRTVDDLYGRGESIERGLALFDQEWGNIEAGQAWVAANAEQDVTAAQLCSDYPDTVIACLELRLRPRERICWLDAALTAARSLYDRNAEANHLGNLGVAYADLGEPQQAIEHYEQASRIFREIGDRRGEGSTLGNLGAVYAELLGDQQRAIEAYELALEIARQSGNRRGEAYVLGNQGNAYQTLGHVRRAIEYFEHHLRIAREIGDRRGEGAVLSNLGMAYASLG